MPASSIPEQTAALFVQAAAAAQSAQRTLDASPDVIGRYYSIPRVAVQAKFSVTEVQGKILIIFGEKSAQQHENQVNFGLSLAPDPVAAVPASAAQPQTTAMLPPFVVPPLSHSGLVLSLKNHLAALDPHQYATELNKIDAAFASRTDDPGFAFLALNTAGRYLLVRLGGDSDGIFLMDEGSPGDFQVFSYWGMHHDPLPWSVFHELFEALRTWQNASLPGVDFPARDLPDKFGAIDVAGFASGMWGGYCEAREQLSLPDPAASALPAYYELHGVSAVLNYSVPPDEGGGTADTIPFIRSQVTIGIDDTNLDAPRIPVRLVAPEFILTGDSRLAVLEQLAENLKLDASAGDSLWSVIDEEYRADYKAALQDPDRIASALVLLSYRDKPPKNQFLFVWTGSIDAEEREFAFRLRYDGTNLVDPMLVFPMEDPINPSGSGIPSPQNPFADATVAYDRNHPGLHDFFHAVWIWTLSGGWF